MIEETEIPAEEEIQEQETTEETKPAAVAEEEVEAEVELTAEELEVESTKKRKSEKTQKRINKLTRRTREAETETARLREELAKHQRPVEPNPDNFEDQNDYINAKVAFEVNKTKPQEATTPQGIDVFGILNQGKEKYEDFDTIVRNPALTQMTQEVAEAIAEGDNPIDSFYHLAKNPIELERISLLDGRDMARELGRLEARLSIPKPRTTQTPKPVKPLDENGAQEPDYKNESMAAYAARMNKKQYG